MIHTQTVPKAHSQGEILLKRCLWCLWQISRLYICIGWKSILFGFKTNEWAPCLVDPREVCMLRMTCKCKCWWKFKSHKFWENKLSWEEIFNKALRVEWKNWRHSFGIIIINGTNFPFMIIFGKLSRFIHRIALNLERHHILLFGTWTWTVYCLAINEYCLPKFLKINGKEVFLVIYLYKCRVC